MKKALLLVDLQKDFMPGGAVPVPDGDAVVEVANRLMDHFELVIATKDSHPPDHCSFADNHAEAKVGETVVVDGLEQVLWNRHCVTGAGGAEFAEGLDAKRVDHVIEKGIDSLIDSYSGFFDNGRRRSTELDAVLKKAKVESVYVMGLATEVCVKATALDAVELEYGVHLVEDGCRGVNLSLGDDSRAIDEMRTKGIVIERSDHLAVAKHA